MFVRKKEVEHETLKNIIKDLQENAKEQKNNNYKILQENETLKRKNSELKSIVKQVNILITANNYGNDKAIKRKIIELTTEHQSDS